MTNHAVGIGTCTQSMTIPSHVFSEMHLQKISDQTEFLSWIVNFQTMVCAKAKNLALVLQWIKKSKQPARWRSSSIRNQPNTGKDFSDYEELDLMMSAELKWCYSIYEITERRAVTRQKGEKLLHRAEDWRMFSAEDNWSCSKRDACSFLHAHATGDREDNVGWSGDTQEILTWSKYTLQYRKWRNRQTWKAWTV